MRMLELFSGTCSIGSAFAEWGWKVISLDLRDDFKPTLCLNLHDWDYKQYPPGYFDCVWGSPPCTHYSQVRPRGKTPRDLEVADKLVLKVREIIDYFEPRVWWVENPGTGMLRHRPCML